MIELEFPNFLASKPGDPRPLCVEKADPEIWFSDERNGIQTANNRNKLINRAKKICEHCPVLAACREWALKQPNAPVKQDTLHGIWGGMTRKERVRSLRNKRKEAA